MRTWVTGAYNGTQRMCTWADMGLQGVQWLCTGDDRKNTGCDRERHGIFIRTEVFKASSVKRSPYFSYRYKDDRLRKLFLY